MTASNGQLTPAMIRAIRGEQSQTEFAQAVGCGNSARISKWENGHEPPLPIFQRALLRLAAERGLTLTAKTTPVRKLRKAWDIR